MAEKIILTADLYDNAVTEKKETTLQKPPSQGLYVTNKSLTASWLNEPSIVRKPLSTSLTWLIRKR